MKLHCASPLTKARMPISSFLLTPPLSQPQPWAHNQGKGLQRCEPRGKPSSHISCSWECRRMWRNEPSHSQISSHFGSWLCTQNARSCGVKGNWHGNTHGQEFVSFTCMLQLPWLANILNLVVRIPKFQQAALSLSLSLIFSCMEFSFYWSLEITDIQDLSVTYSMEVRFFVPTNHFTMMMQFFDWPVMLRIIY